MFRKFTRKHLYQSLFLMKLQASGLKETPTQKFSCRFFQVFKDHVSLQNNSGRLPLQIQYCDLRFKSYKMKLTLEKCVFASITLLFLFLLIYRERELYEYKSNLEFHFTAIWKRLFHL